MGEGQNNIWRRAAGQINIEKRTDKYLEKDGLILGEGRIKMRRKDKYWEKN